MSRIINLDKINIIKREKIKKGLFFIDKNNKLDSVIDKVVIFGSCVNENCEKDSDIDVCLFSDYDSHNPTFFHIFGGFSLEVEDACDMVVYNKVNEKLKKEIDSKGVVVYEL